VTNAFPPDDPLEPDEDQDPVLIEFPGDSMRMPEPLLPRPVGRIAEGHPLKRPLAIAIVVLLIIFFSHFLYTLLTGAASRTDPSQAGAFSSQYREDGSITYQDKILDGWFLESGHEHFMATDGRRFTYVTQHEREGSVVTGYWRLIE
jgi:hypothetical protein